LLSANEECLLAINDVTDRKALEETRRAGREHITAEQASDIRGLVEREHIFHAADQHKNEFLAMLAHELRNPLAPIRTSLDVLRDSGATDSTLEWGWNTIDRQTRHLTRLVDDLLDGGEHRAGSDIDSDRSWDWHSRRSLAAYI
jgi:signal transduction histidine kinase